MVVLLVKHVGERIMSNHWLAPLYQSKHPVIIAGAGCLSSYKELRKFSGAYWIPVVNSLPAAGIVPTGGQLSLGMIGHTGLPSANKIVYESDLVIALGTRLDVRQTGTETAQFAPNAKVFMINNDPDEMARPRIRVDLKYDDCYEFLTSAMADFKKPLDTKDWVKYCIDLECDLAPPDSQFARVIGEIDELYDGDVIFVTGVGSHQQHAARHLTLDYPKRMFLTSAGHGTMGAGLPMAIGAAMETKRKVVLIDGDGSFQLSLNELGTIMCYFPKLDIDIHIIDNGSGGIVSQFCRLNGYDPRETTWSNPDFEGIARAYGLKIVLHRIEEEGCWPIMEGGRIMSDMTYPKEKLQ